MVQNNSPEDCVVGLAVNKCDLKSEFFDEKFCSELESKYKSKFYKISAKTGEGVNQLFNTLIDRTLKLEVQEQSQKTQQPPVELELPKTKVHNAQERCSC